MPAETPTTPEDALYEMLRLTEQPDPDSHLSVFWRKHGRKAANHVTRENGILQITQATGQLGPLPPRSKLWTPLGMFEEQFYRKVSRRHTKTNGTVAAQARILEKEAHIVQTRQTMNQSLQVDWMMAQGIPGPKDTVCIIGDGYGFTTSLLKRLYPELTIYVINLTGMLLMDAIGVRDHLPHVERVLLRETFTRRDGAVHFVSAAECDLLRNQEIDLFINSVSMQEMTPETIALYFDLMRSSTGKRIFSCCNRTEKPLKDGTVLRVDAYPWSAEDEMIIDGECPWMLTQPGPKWPFIHPHPPLIYRLARLSAG